MRVLLCAAAMALCLASQAMAQVRITEWAYQGAEGEFVEFTNFGPGTVDFTGWSYDDDSRLPGGFSLSGFGIIGIGESVVITESDEAVFRAAWNLPSSVKILGGFTNNLGRNDEINLFNGPDAILNLVDRLTYGDQNFPGTIRTQGISGNPTTDAALGVNDVDQWSFASFGDRFNSFFSTGGDFGNPGFYPISSPTIPEPSSLILGLASCAALGLRRRSK
jgi:predicted extracellular nuclease